VASSGATAKRPGGFRRWLDRTVLGLLMGIAIWFVERRLRKVLGSAADASDDKRERTVEVG
jgi:hypothetical protein